MRASAKNFLVRLLDEPAPTSFEAPAQRIWCDYVAPLVDRIETDVYGNRTAVLPGSGKASVMVVGHADEIGLIVKRLDDSGQIWFGKIGGVDPGILPGTRVRILTRKGLVPGVIGRTAVHLLPTGSPPKSPKLTELTIDIGATSKKETQKLVAIGDPVVFGEDFGELAGGFASHRAFDNRMGCWIVAEMLRILSRAKSRVATVYGVSSVQEETGVWGAGLVADRYLPTVAIAVDVTHDTTTPGITSTEFCEIKAGAGPVLGRGVRSNQKTYELLEKAARSVKIAVQVEIDEGYTGTDADPISARRTGVPVGNVSVACRYMHTPCEVIHLRDLEQSAQLLAKFIGLVTDRVDFTPR